MTVLFIFRRDLRIIDNRGLHAAAMTKESIMPIFIYNQTQTKPARNKYFSQRAFDFLNVCITDLSIDCLSLRCYETKQDDISVLKSIIKSTKKSKQDQITSIYFNADLASPFAIERDRLLAEFCKTQDIKCVACTSEYSLVDPSKMAKPYQKITAFYNKYHTTIDATITKEVDQSQFIPCPCKTSQVSIKKGIKAVNRPAALQKLAMIKAKKFKAYGTTRDDISNEQGTTRLSAYLKFGCISVREAFNAAAGNTALQREFIIRAFYDQLAFHFKFKPLKYADKKWTGSDKNFDAWTRGETGFPLVDAAMRQLANTGFMHNRCRMLVASFLVKTLHIDWRRGEQWFAQQLIDYHPASNNGGWQWASGTGSDTQPYFRYFSPWIQSAKHDPQAVYIKRYIPELEKVPVKAIHTWFKSYQTFQDTNYPAPIVDLQTEIKKTMTEYKELSRNKI